MALSCSYVFIKLKKNHPQNNLCDSNILEEKTSYDLPTTCGYSQQLVIKVRNCGNVII